MAWPKLRNRKLPDSLVTVSNRGGEPGEARNSASALAGSPDSPHGSPRGAQDPRQQWKLRARRDVREPHPAQPTLPGHGPRDVREPAPGGSREPAPGGSGPPDGPGGPPAWPGLEPEAAETTEVSGDASFWDWARADDPEPGEGLLEDAREEPRDGGRATAPVTAPLGSRPSWQPVGGPVSAVREEPRPAGIGQRLGNLAHLSANPRMRTWQWRAIIAIVVGAVFTIAVSWRLGLTLAVIVVIADTIYRSRKLMTGVTSAQRKTRRQLAGLERAGYRSLHNGQIPDSEEQIDHLVVGPAGVFAIDSEAWDKRLPVRTRNARQLWHGPESKKERLEHARWESERAAEMLSGALGRQVTVRPVMAVYGPKIPWDVVTIRDVDVFSGPRLRRYLRRRARQEAVRPLGDGEIDKIYTAARAVFPGPSAT
jgi:hypothetical protein